MFADTPVLPLSKRDNVPCSHPQLCCRLSHVPADLVHAFSDQFTQVRGIQHWTYALAAGAVHIRPLCHQ